MKCYVRNRARPEGLIVEAYIADECLIFCSKYMDNVETRFSGNQGTRVFLMKKPLMLTFLGMELILHLRLNFYMMKMVLIKWCGLC